jgi:hypothetical protein
MGVSQYSYILFKKLYIIIGLLIKDRRGASSVALKKVLVVDNMYMVKI